MFECDDKNCRLEPVSYVVAHRSIEIDRDAISLCELGIQAGTIKAPH